MATFLPGGDGHCSCDCQQTTSLLVAEIDRTSEGLGAVSPSGQPRLVSLDDALLLGRRLALDWERVNGCFNADEHLNPGALLTMANTIEQVLKLYEVLLESTYFRRQSHAAVHRGNPSIFTAQSHPPPSQFQVTVVPTSLGTLDLNEEEARIVAQEALRHMIARLGDMLNDIKEESSKGVDDAGDSEEGVLGDVKRARDLMLRLLGRVPR